MIESDLHLGNVRQVVETDEIDRARAGDRDAQEVLVRRYFRDVYALTLRILGNADLAADATQDTMINALNGLRRFRGEASFRTWLLRIAANSARSVGRRGWRRREVAIEAAAAVAAPGRDAESAAVLRDEAGRATELLQRLPPKQRMAVELRINQGLSYAEVAEVMDCTEGAARVNYHLGVKRMREMIK